MEKLFISQPMNGLTEAEIKENRQKAIDKLKRYAHVEFEVIDSFFENAPHDAKPLWYLGKSFELLSTADVIFMLNGWKDARGCRLEHIASSDYGIEILYETDLDLLLEQSQYLK